MATATLTYNTATKTFESDVELDSIDKVVVKALEVPVLVSKRELENALSDYADSESYDEFISATSEVGLLLLDAFYPGGVYSMGTVGADDVIIDVKPGEDVKANIDDLTRYFNKLVTDAHDLIVQNAPIHLAKLLIDSIGDN